MKKMMLALALFFCLTVAFVLAGNAETVVLATDLHYLSPSLTDYGERFMNTVYASDGKIIHYSVQISRAFVRDMLAMKPDAVILSGDLTLNGAPESLKELADLLMPLQAAGIRVLCMPGNHDVGGRAYRFDADGAPAFPAAKNAEFAEIYQELGLNGALSRDELSLSYTAEISENVWALMLDVNANGLEGSVRQKSMAWVEEQLQSAQAQGVTVIGVSHQNLLHQASYYTMDKMINQPKKLQTLYAQYGVKLNLSGHTHMQHIFAQDGITEIVTSALSMTPCQYGVVTLEDGQLRAYDTYPVDVEGWARETGETNEDLLHFSSYAPAFFRDVLGRKIAPFLEGAEIPDEDKAVMLDYAVSLTLRDFTGTRSDQDDESALELWHKYLPGSGYTQYLQAIADLPAQDMNHAVFAE